MFPVSPALSVFQFPYESVRAFVMTRVGLTEWSCAVAVCCQPFLARFTEVIWGQPCSLSPSLCMSCVCSCGTGGNYGRFHPQWSEQGAGVWGIHARCLFGFSSRFSNLNLLYLLPPLDPVFSFLPATKDHLGLFFSHLLLSSVISWVQTRLSVFPACYAKLHMPLSG